MIKDKNLHILYSRELIDLKFIQMLNIQCLKIVTCKNIIPVLTSNTIKELHIESCQLSNIDTIYLEQLEILRLPSNKLKLKPQDLSKYKHLTELDISNNSGIDIMILQNFTNITKLNISDNDILDIYDIKPLTNLVYLDLSFNEQILYISTLKYFINLTVLILNDNLLSDIQVLQFLIDLEKLDLSNNLITNIYPLKYVLYLTELNLANNMIQDISPLIESSYLENLNLSFNFGVNIQPIKYLVDLRILKLQSVGLYDISSLEPLINLEHLMLSDNVLTDISVLQSLSLKVLNIERNNISDLSSIKNHLNQNNYNIEEQYQVSLQQYLKLNTMKCNVRVVEKTSTQYTGILFSAW
ncbi:leucine-rich_repeat domain-containing protein [Hexamita inflata]|uniref:Leucine-rich repeat domain-containing protein n=1 Tax=Hexamita inflata TaxID=28002 RepID=A0AA86NMU2_9EUKA|nr:leucine-rich repeat domain-containing protein [Hexamita inflata]